MSKPPWLAWAEYLPLAMTLPLVARLPHPAALWTGRVAGQLAYRLLGNHRRVCQANLGIAFGERLTAAQVQEYGRGAFVNALQTFLELALLSRLTQPDLARLTLVPSGYDQFRAALAQGRGVIGVSAHFGNWYWPVVCAAVEGFKVNVIVRPLDNPLLDREMNRVLERWGIRVISRRRATVAALAALRRGETVALMVDQNAARHGRFIPFFGTPAATLQGLAPLRRGSGAEVVAVHSRRLDGRHAVSATWLRDLPEEPDGALLAVHRHFEGVIGAAPGDYFWLHPRWKLRPPGEASLYPGLRV